MAEPFIKQSRLSFKLGIVAVAGVVGIAGVVAIIWGGIIFSNYRGSGGVPKMASAPAQVAITDPPTGAWAEADNTLTVDVSAIGPATYNSIELWLDGELAGVQAAPSGGAQPFSTQFSWHPTVPGYHSLIAVGVDMNGNKVISTQVVVLIVPNEFEGENPDVINLNFDVVTPTIAPGSYTGSIVDLPLEAEAINPAGIWAGTLGDLATSLSADQRPNAPELVSRPGECAASLFIHDLSDHEEGFIIYRQMINTPDWQKIATLSSQSQVEWLEYVDQGVSGAMTYYVSAFNSQGEAKSNPVLVNIGPEGCLGEAADMLVEHVDVSLKLTDGSADQVYCYKSQNGVTWERWPAIGFFSPDEEGNLPEYPIMVQRKSDPVIGQGAASQGLMMECWGWQGDGLNKLGEILVGQLQPDFAGKQNILGSGMMVELVIKSEQQASMGGIYPVGAVGLPHLTKEIDPNLFGKTQIKPLSSDIPRVNLEVTYDKDVCGQHIPPNSQNFLGETLFCFPYPEYDKDKGATRYQPYLIWGFDLEPSCIGGTGGNCKNYWELLSMAEETGGQVGFTILAMTEGRKTVWNVTEPDLTMFVVPPLACLGSTEFSVRLWYRPGNQGVVEGVKPDQSMSENGKFEISPAEIQYGPYSNLISIPCNSSGLPDASLVTVTKIRHLDITFNTLELRSISDDPVLDFNFVQLYGYFRVKAPSMGHWAEQYCFTPDLGGCGYEPFWTGIFRYLNISDWEATPDSYGVDGGMHPWSAGYYELEEELLCQSDSKRHCSLFGGPTYYLYNNTTITVFVKDGDVLELQMRLMDYDEASDDDEQCVDSAVTLPLTIPYLDQPYFNIEPLNAQYTLIDGYTGCEVNATMTITGADP